MGADYLMPAFARERRTFESIQSRWIDRGTVGAEQLRIGFPLYLEPKGYCLLEFTPEGAPSANTRDEITHQEGKEHLS